MAFTWVYTRERGDLPLAAGVQECRDNLDSIDNAAANYAHDASVLATNLGAYYSSNDGHNASDYSSNVGHNSGAFIYGSTG